MWFLHMFHRKFGNATWTNNISDWYGEAKGVPDAKMLSSIHPFIPSLPTGQYGERRPALGHDRQSANTSLVVVCFASSPLFATSPFQRFLILLTLLIGSQLSSLLHSDRSFQLQFIASISTTIITASDTPPQVNSFTPLHCFPFVCLFSLFVWSIKLTLK